jgi:hypothetical protein
MRVSGEDHYSALKPPQATQRCRALTQWAARLYAQYDDDTMHVQWRYGVYSETPDCAPLIGSFYDQSACV